MLEYEFPDEPCSSWDDTSGSLSEELKISVCGSFVLIRPFINFHILLAEVNQSVFKAWVHRAVTFKDLPHVQLLNHSLGFGTSNT